jgi:membrane protease subunit HflC
VRAVIGRRTFAEVLREARAEIMEEITRLSDEALRRVGIEVNDVRISRTELPGSTLKNVYARMRAERERQARKYRAEGEEEARRIRAEADRRSRVIVAEAREKAQGERGRGDADAVRITAEAFSLDPGFYAFQRTLEAYRKTLGEHTTVVLPPDHEFFRLFGTGHIDLGAPGPDVGAAPEGGGAAGAPAP